MTLTILETAAVTPPRLCAYCTKPLETRSGRGRPAVYCGPECRAMADNARDRDQRRAEKATLDSLIDRAGRASHGKPWLEPKQLPAADLPDDYWTGLALAVEVVIVHGPATDGPDDPRLPAFTSGVCRIIDQGTRPPEVTLLELAELNHMAVLAVDDSAQDELARLYEMCDPHRQRQPWMPGAAGQAWDGPANATQAVDLYGNPVSVYVPPGPRWRTPVPVRDDSYATCQEYYDRDRRRAYRAPYFGLAWNHGPEAIAFHVAPALAAYVADAT